MNKYSYIEPLIRTIAGAYIIVCGVLTYIYPDSVVLLMAVLLFLGINLFQSGLSRFCIMEKALKRIGFRSEMDEIRTLALNDALTDLPNRLFIETEIEKAIINAKREGYKVGMLFIDLDNFKQINDAQGHKAGDQILIKIGAILKTILRKSDTLARWGGDEFVILLPEIQEAETARNVADKLIETIQKDLIVDEVNLNVTLSIGVAIFPDDADSCETLLIQADKALFYSKSQGRNNVQVYSEMRANNLGFHDFELTSRFAATVNRQEIQVYFQPIVDAYSRRPVCIEALARMHDETLGWVSPIMFIPLAEKLGLIHKVGQQVIEKAINQYPFDLANKQVQLAVNISNRQLVSRSFIPSIFTLVEKYNLLPGQIKFEITESIALDTYRAKDTLRQLTEEGFCISLDDFGTGFSSLSRLHELRVDELKIDISFVRRINTAEGRIMIQSIIDMGHAMNLSLVAEGVEDEETASILCEMGVEKLQGYQFARPMPYAECKKYMESYSDLKKSLSTTNRSFDDTLH